ncbi:MAG TPA: SirB2 family protein [Rubrivivax sp.]
MIEFYPQVRAVHVSAVLASGALFALRGVAVLASARWPLAAPVRYTSYAIDSVLLTAALMLLTMLPGAVFANHWLSAKLSLLVVYIVLGSFALKRGRSARGRAICFAAAVAVYAGMFGIARAHHPLGWLARLDASCLMQISGGRSAAA